MRDVHSNRIRGGTRSLLVRTVQATLGLLILCCVAACSSDGGSSGFDLSNAQRQEQQLIDEVVRDRRCDRLEGILVCAAQDLPMSSRPLLSDPVLLTPDAGEVLRCVGSEEECTATVNLSGGLLPGGQGRLQAASTVLLAVGPIAPPQGWVPGNDALYAPEGLKANTSLQVVLRRGGPIALRSGTRVRVAMLLYPPGGEPPRHEDTVNLLADFGADLAVVATDLVVEIAAQEAVPTTTAIVAATPTPSMVPTLPPTMTPTAPAPSPTERRPTASHTPVVTPTLARMLPATATAATVPTGTPAKTLTLPPRATRTLTRTTTATPTSTVESTPTRTQTATPSETRIVGTTFRASLTEEQPVSGTTGEAMLVVNSDETILAFEVTISGEASTILKAELHVAPRGFDGPAVFTLAQASAQPLQSPVRGTRTEADLRRDSNVNVATFADVAGALKDGDAYVTVRVAQNPSAIRGQIRAPTRFVARLNGDQHVPPVETGASGEVTFVLAPDESSVTFELRVSNLDPTAIRGARLAIGSPGSNGSLLAVPAPGSFENPLRGTVDLVASALPDFVSALKAGRVYVTVQTASHPDGLIRGQVKAPLQLQAVLSGDQEVPPVNSPDDGRALLVVNSERTALRLAFEARLAVSRCPNMRVHVHVAPPGMNGPIVFNLPGDPVTGFLRWQLSAADLIAAPESGIETLDDFVGALEAGDAYVNMVSGLNPEGEIRGQLQFAP
ncbi:MAG: CHRD domain-containing protein [Candidatus Binatia bacterium]